MAPHKGDKKNLQDPEFSDFDPDVDITAPEGYTVVDKDLPSPTPYPVGSNKTIKWFNAFGVQKPGAGDSVTYTVKVQRPPAQGDKNKTPRRLFYLYNNTPTEITDLSDAGINDKGKPVIMFTLTVGDPPIGSYP